MCESKPKSIAWLSRENFLNLPLARVILWRHREVFQGAAPEMVTLQSDDRLLVTTPGIWRNLPEHDVIVGHHHPPSSGRVADFMLHFETRYRLEPPGKSSRIVAMTAAHRRFNFIHPFPDGNGRVSRLMNQTIGHGGGYGGAWPVVGLQRARTRIGESE